MKCQSVATRVIVVSISILVMIVVGVFFMINMGGASESVSSANTQNRISRCQTMCQDLITLAFNYDNCNSLEQNPNVQAFRDQCLDSYGACTVTVKNSVTCVIE